MGLRLRFFMFAAASLFAAGLISFPNRKASAQHAPSPGPNSDPTYQALRHLTLGNEAVALTNFHLKRDAGTFHLRSATVCFLAPVNGTVTGAVFAADASVVL